MKESPKPLVYKKPRQPFGCEESRYLIGCAESRQPLACQPQIIERGAHLAPCADLVRGPGEHSGWAYTHTHIYIYIYIYIYHCSPSHPQSHQNLSCAKGHQDLSYAKSHQKLSYAKSHNSLSGASRYVERHCGRGRGAHPPMLLRCCLPWGLRIVRIQEIPSTLCQK